MAVPFRQQLPVVLAVLAMAVHFAPELTVEQRSFGSSALWLAAMLWNFAFSPKVEPVEQPPRIIWDERDDGEKFSLVMFHLVIGTVASILAYQILQQAVSPEGQIWMVMPAILIMASTCWLIWSNWKNRNAR